MYHGKNEGNFGISHREKQLPTTMKVFINDVLDSNIKNDHYGAHKLFLGNRYACTKLFEILVEDMNLQK